MGLRGPRIKPPTARERLYGEFAALSREIDEAIAAHKRGIDSCRLMKQRAHQLMNEALRELGLDK